MNTKLPQELEALLAITKKQLDPEDWEVKTEIRERKDYFVYEVSFATNTLNYKSCITASELRIMAGFASLAGGGNWVVNNTAGRLIVDITIIEDKVEQFYD